MPFNKDGKYSPVESAPSPGEPGYSEDLRHDISSAIEQGQPQVTLSSNSNELPHAVPVSKSPVIPGSRKLPRWLDWARSDDLEALAKLTPGPSPEMKKAMEGVLAGVGSKSTSSNDTFVGRFLPLLGGAFLTVPPSVSVAIALKSESPNWYVVGAFIFACWVLAALLVAAGVRWPKWKPDHEVLARKVVALSNSKLAWLTLLLLIAVVPAASVGWLVRNKVEGYTQAQLDEAVSQAKTPLQSQLDEVTKQRDASSNELTSARRELAKLRQIGSQPSSPASQPAPSSSAPVDWNLGGQLIVGDGRGVSYLIFQGQSTVPLHFREAYLISGLTGHKAELKANVQQIGTYFPVKDVDVPANAPVQLDLQFQPPLLVRDFFDQWGKFSLVISYENGDSFEHEFDERTVREKVQQQFPNAIGPHVTPRETGK